MKNIQKILRKYDFRPKTAKNIEFDARVSFESTPHDEFCARVYALNLEVGNTLCAKGIFLDDDSSRKRIFYTHGKMADWLEKIEIDKPYYLKLRCLFGVVHIPSWELYSVKGFQIISTFTGNKSKTFVFIPSILHDN